MRDDELNRENPREDAVEASEPGDRSNVPALAIGALDGDEREAALAELRASESARRELRDLEQVVGDLGLAAESVAPPPDLRDRILHRTSPAGPVSIEQERVTRLSPPVWIGALAAGFLIVVLGTIAISQWMTARDRGERIDELQSELTLQEEHIAQLEAAAASAGAFINFEDPLIWTRLSAPAAGEPSPGFLARSEDGRTAYLVLTGVQIDPGQVFQAWLIEDMPVPAGTFRTSEDGLGFLILEHDREPVHEFSVIGITVEPPGGSPQPTSDPIVVAEIV